MTDSAVQKRLEPGGTPLGDSHNFGRRVARLPDGRIFKPRPIVWESLFLGINSPLRAKIDEVAVTDGIRSPLTAVTALSFEASEGGLAGTVTPLELAHLPPDALDSEALGNIGAAIGYVLWFGLGDLHRENVLLGRDASGGLFFGPIDVECAFDDLHLPSQSSLLPHQGRLEESAGLACLKNGSRAEHPYDLAALCGRLSESLGFFERHDAEFYAELCALDLAAMPVRLILRSTRDYHRLMKDPSYRAEDVPLDQAELIQMERGDVPYFFRTFSSLEVLYYSNPEVPRPAEIAPARSARATGLARLPEGRSFAPRRHAPALRDLSRLQIARYLDPGIPHFESVSGSLRVLYDGKNILIEGPRGRRISCRRRDSKHDASPSGA